MNAAFHEGIAAGSGNRYILAAIRRQTELRRFSNYDWLYGTERVAVNCREHLAILDRLAENDREIAALLLRRHIETAMQLRRPDPAPD
jgi:DNA-binding GntR family transcriptional regulator